MKTPLCGNQQVPASPVKQRGVFVREKVFRQYHKATGVLSLPAGYGRHRGCPAGFTNLRFTLAASHYITISPFR